MQVLIIVETLKNNMPVKPKISARVCLLTSHCTYRSDGVLSAGLDLFLLLCVLSLSNISLMLIKGATFHNQFHLF